MPTRKLIVNSEKLIVSKGVSLLEMLVVVSVFAILAILSTQVLILTLRGSRKSDTIAKVRENLDFSLSTMERLLRNASTISPCPNSDPTVLAYKDQSGISSSFSCPNVGASGYIASGSGRLTTDTISITSCSLSCSPAVGNTPPYVDISIIGQDKNAIGAEGVQVTAQTKIYLRTY